MSSGGNVCMNKILLKGNFYFSSFVLCYMALGGWVRVGFLALQRAFWMGGIGYWHRARSLAFLVAGKEIWGRGIKIRRLFFVDQFNQELRSTVLC
jgi:hypothetical protein